MADIRSDTCGIMYQAGEMNAAIMISHHNLAFFLETMKRARAPFDPDRFDRFRSEFL